VQGHDVRVEYDGAGGIREAQAFRPQVILLDIGLPGTNGYDVCRALRQQPWGRSALIIAMTGWGQEEDRRNSRDAGFDHHLVKPAKPQLVDSLLQDLARR
jgi:DNA-binding response OmpR family regulator